MVRSILILIPLVLAAAEAQAYIDPGTGGYVYSLLAPFVAMGAAALAFFLRPVRRFFVHLYRLVRPRDRTGRD
ncbi:MAG: hypothetical protein AB1896_03175 [Thermodesulfobacteriota bacterium]